MINVFGPNANWTVMVTRSRDLAFFFTKLSQGTIAMDMLRPNTNLGERASKSLGSGLA